MKSCIDSSSFILAQISCVSLSNIPTSSRQTLSSLHTATSDGDEDGIHIATSDGDEYGIHIATSRRPAVAVAGNWNNCE